MKQKNPRARAALILGNLRLGQGSLSSSFTAQSSDADDALVREFCFGCCRFYQELEFLLGQLLSKPVRNKDADVASLLLLGIYQIRYLRIPDHAAVNETVSAAEALGKPWATSLVNGVLRSYIKKQSELNTSLQQAPGWIRFSHPEWLYRHIQKDWPEAGEGILANNNCRPPMTLRVNLTRVSREDYLGRLLAAGMPARPGVLTHSSIYLENPCSVNELPGFAQGLVSIQDESSQLVASLLDLRSGLRVLDACAAPGGKTALILESEQSLTGLLAIDASVPRLTNIRENLDRLGLTAEIRQGDAAKPDRWWDRQGFDRILLDAPCSATGVIRRHPDIKLLRRESDIKELAQRQSDILAAIWPVLAPGGLLLYSTCSVLRQENEDVIAGFMQSHPDAKYAPISADWGVKCSFGRQLLPDREGTDGFYFCRLMKSESATVAPQ